MKNLIVTCKDKLAAVKTTLATMLFFAFSSAHAALPDTALWSSPPVPRARPSTAG